MIWPLMKNNITREDLDQVIKYLQQEDPRLTNGPKVKSFEEAWGSWLGTSYNVMLNSGSSANIISLAVLREIFPEGGEVIVSPLNWVSDIVAVLRAGFTPVFVDIDLRTLGMNLNLILQEVTNKTRAILLTHILGYNALEPWFLDKLQEIKSTHNILLINDICESYGATMGGVQVGALGDMSNSSFYFAHIASTIEGGMISTNSPEIYDASRIYRSNGRTGESCSEKLIERYKTDYPDLHPEFIFAVQGYNMRPTEINAIIGLSQLNTIDEDIKKRNKNLELFLSSLDSKYFTDYKLEGCSNYAFTLLLSEESDILMKDVVGLLQKEGVEYRRGMSGGGNQLRQPYLQEKYNIDPKVVRNTEFVHMYGLYFGNYPDLEEENILNLTDKLNKL